MATTLSQLEEMKSQSSNGNIPSRMKNSTLTFKKVRRKKKCLKSKRKLRMKLLNSNRPNWIRGI
jgi:hypothetical protein